MRSFADVAKEQELFQWGMSQIGSLHLPHGDSIERPMFRFFDGPHDLLLVQPYAEVVEACRRWVAARPDVAAMIEIEPILEVGTDFVCRTYKQAYVTLRTYHEQEQPGYADEYLEPPPELAAMRSIVSQALAGSSNGREGVIRRVLSASLLEGAGKTVQQKDFRWRVLEPSISRDDLQNWVAQKTSESERADPERGLLDVLPIYQRQGEGEYFENEVADIWPEMWWGLPGFARERLALPKPDVPLKHFRSESGSPQLRSEVSGYLDAGATALAGQVPEQKCEFCDRMINIASYQSDGVWLWTSDLGHQVAEHGFFVPNRLVDHIREIGRPPASFDTPVEELPWPKKK